MEKKRFKVGLVGVGNISGAHIPAWDSMEDADKVKPEELEAVIRILNRM